MNRSFSLCLAGALLGLGALGCATSGGGDEISSEQAPKDTARIIEKAVVVQETSGTAEPGDVIRVSAFNIQDFTDGVEDEDERTPTVVERHLKAAARSIDAVNADIQVIEEIENGAILMRMNQALARTYPVAHMTSFGSGQGRGDKLNIAVLSRLPLSNVVELDCGVVQVPIRLSRGALSFQVELGGGHRLLVYGVHLKSNYGGQSDLNVAKRQEVLKIIRAHSELVMEAAPETKWEVVLLGDTNVDPDLEAFATDASFAPFADYSDLFRGMPIEKRTTIPRRIGDPAMEFADACFDRIFAGPGLVRSPWRAGVPAVYQQGVALENVYINPGENDFHVSDHYPVYVDLYRE